MLIEGQRLGDFEILDHIGQGGMGAVFKARQHSLERIVALKTLKPFLSDDPEYVARFHQEAVAAAALNHPNLVQVYAAGEAEGIHYFAMEYIDGESAERRLQRHADEGGDGRIEPLEAIAIATHVSVALDHGWRKAALIHRDVKPDNVFLSTEGEVKLGDLGLAKSSGQSMMTQTGAAIGTPHYISPEQADGAGNIDLRADIYSLGCTLYHLLSGQPPYKAESSIAIMLKHVNAPVPDLRAAWPESPPELAALVFKMMQKTPADRFQTHAEVGMELRRVYDFLCGNSVPDAVGVAPDAGARRSGIQPGVRGVPVKKSPLPLYAGIAVAVLVLAAVAFFLSRPKPVPGSATPQPVAASVSPPPMADAAPPRGGTDPSPANATKDAPHPNTPGTKLISVGWQPLFTEAEWNKTIPNKHEIVDGRLHLRLSQYLKQQPAADGAIRARIRFQQGSSDVGFFARVTTDGGHYKAELISDRVLVLNHFAYGHTSPDAALGKYALPKPLQPGDSLLLELRLQGDHLTVLVDGSVAIEAQDARSPGPGQWGIIATDGWYESVEVQTLPPGATTPANPLVAPSAAGWQPLFTEAEWKQAKPGQYEVVNGRLHLSSEHFILREKPQPAADGALRARLQFQQGTKNAGLMARKTVESGLYRAYLSSEKLVSLEYYPGGNGASGEQLGAHSLPKPLQPGDTVSLELRLQGEHLTVLVDGAVVIEARDSRCTGPGKWGIFATNGWFESAEVRTLSPAAVAPPNNLAAPAAAGWQPLFTDAEWKQTIPGRHEIVDGRLHLLGSSVPKPQPAADCAIRARIQFQEGSKYVGFVTRITTEGGCYKAHLYSDRRVSLEYYAPGKSSGVDSKKLGVYFLAKPLQPGDTVLLELRMQGDRLTVLLDGAVVIRAQDSHCPGPGQWEITANNNGRFESVEVQTLPAAKPSAQVSGAPIAAATKEAPFVNSLGMKFVPVPIIGGPTDKQRVLFSVWDTRVQDYAAFATETTRDWKKAPYEQGPTHPAVNVSWEDAQAFCQWLTARERAAGRLPAGAFFRLPSDHEWSCAVGIGAQEDPAKLPSEKSLLLSDIYPWGGTWPAPDDAGNYSSAEAAALPKEVYVQAVASRHDGYGATAPVGSYRANALGLYDLGGNVWEWCEDWINQKHSGRVMRGASFTDNNSFAPSARRTAYPPKSAVFHAGFRVVLALPSESAIAAATKDAPFVNSLGMKFVPVSGTNVLFCIHETRWRDCAAYVNDTGAEMSAGGKAFVLGGAKGAPDVPAAHVSWDDAQAFCTWLSRQEGRTYRLPTDREWSQAVGIGDQEKWTADTTPATVNQVPDQFPWGTEWPPPKGSGNYRDETYHAKNPKVDEPYLKGFDDGFDGPAPVMSFTPNRFGIYDLGGNVDEWMADWYDALQQKRTFRGAAYGDANRAVLLSSKRFPADANATNSAVGFRIVVERPPVAKPTPPPASEVEKWLAQVDGPQQEAYRKQVVQPFEAGLAEMRTRYLAALDAAIAKASAASQLTEALAFRTERKTFAEAQNVPADDAGVPPAVQALRANFRQQLAKLDQARLAKAKALFAGYDAILEKNQALLTQRQRLDEALLLKTKRDELAGAWLAPSPLVPAAAPASPEPARATPATPAPPALKDTGIRPTAATRETPFVNTLEMQFVPVAITHGPTAGKRVLFGIWDVRVQDYQVFADETKRPWPKPTFSQDSLHPAVNVSWEDGKAFCAWLTERERKAGKLAANEEYRLPSDLEWSCAVGLPQEPGEFPALRTGRNQVDFPWGRFFPPKKPVGNYGEQLFADGYVQTSPVGAFPANRFGLFDMGGNVWQWCEDLADTVHPDRTLRGGSWRDYDREPLLSSMRYHYLPASRSEDRGFRCVLGLSAR